MHNCLQKFFQNFREMRKGCNFVSHTTYCTLMGDSMQRLSQTDYSIFISMLLSIHSFFYIRTSNFDAEAERSYIFWRFEAETFLKMFLNLPGDFDGVEVILEQL